MPHPPGMLEPGNPSAQLRDAALAHAHQLRLRREQTRPAWIKPIHRLPPFLICSNLVHPPCLGNDSMRHDQNARARPAPSLTHFRRAMDEASDIDATTILDAGMISAAQAIERCDFTQHGALIASAKRLYSPEQRAPPRVSNG
ncbi:MAG: hypothetical protein ACREFL_00195 [Stellaceae bacterium]